jgi:hypothetical protein
MFRAGRQREREKIMKKWRKWREQATMVLHSALDSGPRWSEVFLPASIT